VPVLIALMHDLLITSGVYALVGREVTVDTVAALLTILGYSLYDTIIVFDRVRENIPRMPRAAFSQIVNRSMSEVLTRSIATTSCTLLPILALLLFGGSTLRDFAFALLIGVASGAYSSIFIASPVLTHWKERESTYRHRRDRIISDHGAVPAYAAAGSDIEPARKRGRGRPGRLTEPDAENVSAAEFEQMKRDLDIERDEPGRRTSTLTKRLAHGREEGSGDAGQERPRRRGRGGPASSGSGSGSRPASSPSPARGGKAAPEPPEAAQPPESVQPPATAQPPESAQPPTTAQPPAAGNGDSDGQTEGGYRPAPDEAENEGMAPVQKPARSGKGRPRNRRHGRHR
jgi:SecD/SecF fusion protein